jgi:peroxiredoxin Q/BCP
MVELRKRKAAAEPAAPPPLKKASSVKSVQSTTSSKKGESSTNGSAPAIKASTGDTIIFKGFGGDIETNDGVKVTLEKLVDESKSGVVIFTYPKASTPGCKCAIFMCLETPLYNHLATTLSLLCRPWAIAAPVGIC